MIEVKDFIHATYTNPSNGAVMVQQFVLTEVDGTLYKGGAVDCDTANGWTVEILRKDVSNLRLPSTISEIVVTDRSNNKHLLVGKGENWKDEKGKLFEISGVVSWAIADD
jgi:hypothetical protein